MDSLLPTRWHRARYPLAAALCLTTAAAALPLRDVLDLANIVMLFLLAVFGTAVWCGRGPAVLAAFLSVALVDFLFVPPHFSFAVADAQYLVTFAVMLAVGLITSHLAARLSERRAHALLRERETRILFELARDLGSALTLAQVTDITRHFLDGIALDATVLVADGPAGTPVFQAHGPHRLTALELNIARSAYLSNTIAETDSLAGKNAAIAFLPLNAPTRVRGVLAVVSRSEDMAGVRRHRPLLESVALLLAIVIERLHYADAARRSELQVEAEQLRTTILSSLSHDLRTPLTSLVGLADVLVQRQPALPDDARETAGIIRDQAQAMYHMLSNLLDMAKLQAGTIALNKAWQPFEEIVGSSTRLLRTLLADRSLEISLARDLPLVNFDAVLLERVVCNLLENAAKYSAAGARIQVQAATRQTWLEVAVCNDGGGFPAAKLAQVFEPFVRGERETAVAGTGMGLAICKSIVAAHGGSIVAENRPGGACVRFTLPLGTPPGVEEEGA